MMQPFVNPNYFQNQYQIPSYTNAINGMYVDNRAVVEAQQPDMSGKPMYFPTTDGNSIFVKQIDNFGKSRIVEYIPNKNIDIPNMNNDIPSTNVEELVSKMDEINEKLNKLLKPAQRKKEADE